MLALVAAWFKWCGDYVVEAPAGRAAWVDERLEYQFAVGAQTGAGEHVLTAPAYDGEPLDWYDFDVDGSVTLGAPTKPAPPTPLQAKVIPAPVVYPGMPAPRFWQFEDARVDFGAVDAAPADLAHLLLIEFATVFGNDWFVAPVADVHVGSLVTLQTVTLSTTFGDSVTLQPLADTAAASGTWRMFELSAIAGTGAPPPTDRLLLVPPSLASRLDGVQLEEVDFVRDAQAALVWAIERFVESTAERPLDRQQQFEARLEQERLAAGPPPPALAPLVYRLETDVDDYWIPFLPELAGGHSLLARAAMVRPKIGGGTEPIVPLGRVVGPTSAPRTVFDEEVPREGTKVVRTYRYARWSNGSTYLWAARRRRTAGGASSGLQFDSVEPAQ